MSSNRSSDVSPSKIDPSFEKYDGVDDTVVKEPVLTGASLSADASRKREWQNAFTRGRRKLNLGNSAATQGLPRITSLSLLLVVHSSPMGTKTP
jgi:hypothetical protein